MWSGFSSEIETAAWHPVVSGLTIVACGAASRLRLKRGNYSPQAAERIVACGAASRLRLKQPDDALILLAFWVACGAASRLRLKHDFPQTQLKTQRSRMWSGFSSEIETKLSGLSNCVVPRSHVERLLV